MRGEGASGKEAVVSPLRFTYAFLQAFKCDDIKRGRSDYSIRLGVRQCSNHRAGRGPEAETSSLCIVLIILPIPTGLYSHARRFIAPVRAVPLS